MNTWQIIQGDCLEVMQGMEEASIQCVVTSPPYWGLRDYGVDGQLGLESTPDEYVAKMVEIFREVKRVLRSDGTCWLNLGDSYGSSGGDTYADFNLRYSGTGGSGSKQNQALTGVRDRTRRTNLKPKDLCMMPARVALGLQADGWWLRQDIIEEVQIYCPHCGWQLEERIWRHGQDREIIWKKPNPMPESCTDRCTKAHEYIFLLTKSARYYYDAEAVKEASESAGESRGGGKKYSDRTHDTGIGGAHNLDKYGETPAGRNKRSVWTIATQAFPGAHFATFPEKLVEPCIAAGTSERGCCQECGKPWERIVEKSRTFESGSGRSGNSINGKQDAVQGGGKTLDIRRGPVVHTNTQGWQPACKCGREDTVPCTVMDPFAGSGTTGVISQKNESELYRY